MDELDHCPSCAEPVEPDDDECQYCGEVFAAATTGGGCMGALVGLGALFGVILLLVFVGGAVALWNMELNRERSFVGRAQADLSTFESAIKLYRIHVGDHPDSLDDLMTQPPGTQGWRGPYLAATPSDPWGIPYDYQRTESGYRLICYGADGALGGTGVASDLTAGEGE